MKKEEKNAVVYRAACNRAFNSYCNTLVVFMFVQLYKNMSQDEKKDTSIFLKMAEKEVLVETLELVIANEKLNDSEKEELQQMIKKTLDETSEPLKRIMKNIQLSRKDLNNKDG